jgi:hypothetical protein
MSPLPMSARRHPHLKGWAVALVAVESGRQSGIMAQTTGSGTEAAPSTSTRDGF